MLRYALGFILILGVANPVFAQSCTRTAIESVVLIKAADGSSQLLDITVRYNRKRGTNSISSRSSIRSLGSDTSEKIVSAGKFNISRVTVRGGRAKTITLEGTGTIQTVDGNKDARISAVVKSPTTNQEGQLVGEASLAISLSDDTVHFSSFNTEYTKPSFISFRKRAIACR